jgi:hypothetical protein
MEGGGVEDGRTSTDEQEDFGRETEPLPQEPPADESSSDQTGTDGQSQPKRIFDYILRHSDPILRGVVILLGIVIVFIALMRLTETNSIVAIFALFIGAMLAVLGLFYARVTNLGGSQAPRVRKPSPSSVTAQDVAGRVVESPKFLRMVVTQLLLTHTAIKQIVMDQPPEVKAQIYEALKEEIRENPG